MFYSHASMFFSIMKVSLRKKPCFETGITERSPNGSYGDKRDDIHEASGHRIKTEHLS